MNLNKNEYEAMCMLSEGKVDTDYLGELFGEENVKHLEDLGLVEYDDYVPYLQLTKEGWSFFLDWQIGNKRKEILFVNVPKYAIEALSNGQLLRWIALVKRYKQVLYDALNAVGELVKNYENESFPPTPEYLAELEEMREHIMKQSNALESEEFKRDLNTDL